MTFDSLINKMLELIKVFQPNSGDPKPEEYKNYSYMKEHNDGYSWYSAKDYKHSIMVRDKFILIGPDSDTLFLQIEDTMPDELNPDPIDVEYDYNVLYVKGSEAVLAVQRYSTTKIMLMSEAYEDDYEKAIIFDYETLTEDEWFQYSLMLEIPTFEVIQATKPFFDKMKEVSTTERREITIYVGAELDYNNLVGYTEEDFK